MQVDGQSQLEGMLHKIDLIQVPCFFLTMRFVLLDLRFILDIEYDRPQLATNLGVIGVITNDVSDVTSR